MPPHSNAVLTGTGTIIGGQAGSNSSGLIKTGRGIVHAVTLSGTGGLLTVHLHNAGDATATGTQVVVSGTTPFHANLSDGGVSFGSGVRVVISGTTGGAFVNVVYD